MYDPRERLIVALDVSSSALARQIVSAVGEAASIYKVGMQLYTAEGPQVVRDLVAAGRRVFLDLKYHDIPNTVASAVKEAAALKVSMLTVHAAGGSRMLRAATDVAWNSNPDLMVLAVTVLTSMDESDLAETGVPGDVQPQVSRLAAMAVQSGCKGIVSSAREVAELRRQLGSEIAIVTPGVRPAGANHGDQTRVMTPAQAISAGASHIVVGRPIIEALDPSAAAKAIVEEMREMAFQ
jgi:orotidine-5'-phosphate decarboxylase